jgi:hypothetical protein
VPEPDTVTPFCTVVLADVMVIPPEPVLRMLPDTVVTLFDESSPAPPLVTLPLIVSTPFSATALAPERTFGRLPAPVTVAAPVKSTRPTPTPLLVILPSFV